MRGLSEFPKDNYLKYTFPENILRDVYIENMTHAEKFMLVPGISMNVFRALHNIDDDPDRFKSIIAVEERYLGQLTYVEIADHIKESVARTRCLIVGVLQYLRHPNFIQIFNGNFKTFEEVEKFTIGGKINSEKISNMNLVEVLELPLISTSKLYPKIFRNIRDVYGNKFTVSQLIKVPDEKLLTIWGIGFVSIKLLKKFYAFYGVKSNEENSSENRS